VLGLGSSSAQHQHPRVTLRQLLSITNTAPACSPAPGSWTKVPGELPRSNSATPSLFCWVAVTHAARYWSECGEARRSKQRGVSEKTDKQQTDGQLADGTTTRHGGSECCHRWHTVDSSRARGAANDHTGPAARDKRHDGTHHAADHASRRENLGNRLQE